MAAKDPLKDLCEEATCPICLDYFKDPVTTECGHNFCQACLTQCLEESGRAETSCPQCREKVLQRNLRPNRQLANFVELTKKLSLQKPRKEEGKERVCGKHQEPLKLFCKNHQTSICVVCDKSKEHEHHKVIPLDEALEVYKDDLWYLLETLKKERENILACKAEREQGSQRLLEQTKIEKGRTVAAFRQMHQFLEEQEKLLLAQMEETDKEISAKKEDHLARLSEAHSSLEGLIREVEEKSRQPASELLQDIGSFLQGYYSKAKIENPVAFPPALKWKIWDICDVTPFLEGVLKQFRDTLESGLHQKKAAKVTLDPEKASPSFILSEDHQTVTYRYNFQDLPDNTESFDGRAYMLGREGFTGGRHFLEVIVGNEEAWSVGVVSKSMRRKVLIDPKGGIWEMGKWRSAYRTSYPSRNSFLPLKETPKRIRVTLNCEGGRVAFYNADTAALIFEFPPVSFSGETLHPLFYMVHEAFLTLCP